MYSTARPYDRASPDLAVDEAFRLYLHIFGATAKGSNRSKHQSNVHVVWIVLGGRELSLNADVL